MMKRTLAFIAFFFLFSLCSSKAEAVSSVTIAANGSGGPVSLAATSSLSVAISLTAGAEAGEEADWWVAASTPMGWYHFSADTGSWAPGLVCSYQGPLFDLGGFPALTMSGLPAGSYTFYFGVDMEPNRELDMDSAEYDAVQVTVTSPVPAGFDGTWIASGTPISLFDYENEPCGSVNGTLNVSNGWLSGSGTSSDGDSLSFSGTVATSGSVAIDIASAWYGPVGEATGTFSGSSGSGSWYDYYGCYGTWTAYKR